jgi:CRISPR-associated protein Cas1
MPFAYVTEPGAAVHAKGRTLLVKKAERTLAEWELTHLEALMLIGGVHLTTPAMKALLRAGVETAFLSAKGKLIGQLTPPKPGNVSLRLAQYALSSQPEQRLVNARAVVVAKIAAMGDVLHRYADNYPELPLDAPRQKLGEAQTAAAAAPCPGTLRGIEGSAAAAYWGAFRHLNRSPLDFQGRKARPPRDPINALLSLGYVLLVNEIWSILDAMGFDPFLGVYHEVRPNRPSLALDLVEPFRHHVIDRMVLRSVNLGRFSAADRVQQSVFEGWLLPEQVEETWERLQQVADPAEDDVRVYRLCSYCCRDARVLGPNARREMAEYWIV